MFTIIPTTTTTTTTFRSMSTTTCPDANTLVHTTIVHRSVQPFEANTFFHFLYFNILIDIIRIYLRYTHTPPTDTQTPAGVHTYIYIYFDFEIYLATLSPSLAIENKDIYRIEMIEDG